MPCLARIRIYPIKSLDGWDVPAAPLLPGGALRYDRRWAIVNDAGVVINGKRNPRVQQIRVRFEMAGDDSADARTGKVDESPVVTVEHGPSRVACHLGRENADLERVLGECLGEPVRLVENSTTGFPDDLEAPGPTVISTATLETVAGWFPGLTVEEVRRRFRANLELADCPAFWEDRLFGPVAGEDRPSFQIGRAQFIGTNPCQRCAVPTRHSFTGEANPDFRRQFIECRQRTLPAEVARSRFDHFYRLAVNTRRMPAKSGEESATLRVGDSVELLGE